MSSLERIDAPLAPFDGRFIARDGQKHMLEGTFVGDLILIAFPDLKRAGSWYQSPAHHEILPLRTQCADGAILLMERIDEDYRATDILQPR